MLQTYGSFRPTGFDHAGAFLHDQQDWLVAPCTHNRDSGIREESNWHAQHETLSQCDDEDWEEHSFGHWACGWFEIAIVRPGSTAADRMEELVRVLNDYPILDDQDYSEREWIAAHESWQYTSLADRVAILAKHDLCRFAARRDEIPTGLPYWDDFYEAY